MFTIAPGFWSSQSEKDMARNLIWVFRLDSNTWQPSQGKFWGIWKTDRGELPTKEELLVAENWRSPWNNFSAVPSNAHINVVVYECDFSQSARSSNFPGVVPTSSVVLLPPTYTLYQWAGFHLRLVSRFKEDKRQNVFFPAVWDTFMFYVHCLHSLNLEKCSTGTAIPREVGSLRACARRNVTSGPLEMISTGPRF